MTANRALLPFDFSLSGFAAHYRLLRMQRNKPYEVVLFVVGSGRRYPAPESLRPMAELLARAHRASGGNATVRFTSAHPHDAVEEMLASGRFDLVVTGSELMPCLDRDESLCWLIVEPARGAHAERADWPALPNVGARESGPSGDALSADHATPDLRIAHGPTRTAG